MSGLLCLVSSIIWPMSTCMGLHCLWGKRDKAHRAFCVALCTLISNKLLETFALRHHDFQKSNTEQKDRMKMILIWSGIIMMEDDKKS